MNTIAISDNIQGNVGGCDTHVSKVETGASWWIIDYKTYATNSCTGKVEAFTTWGPAPLGAISIIIALLTILIIVAHIKDN